MARKKSTAWKNLMDSWKCFQSRNEQVTEKQFSSDFSSFSEIFVEGEERVWGV